MTVRHCVVIERQDDWMIVVGDESQFLPSDVSADELTTCVDLMAKRAGLKSVSCVLAPASTSCYFAVLEAGKELDVRDRSALLFELEDHLPIDAESMVADFVVIPSAAEDKRVSAVAVETRRWSKFADALEVAGVPVRSIVPATVLAARAACRGTNLTDTVEYAFVSDSHIDLVTIRSETMVGWKHVAADTKLLRRHRLLSESEPDRVVIVADNPQRNVMIEEVYGRVEIHADDVETCVLRGAALGLTKQSNRWFELRRDELGPSDPLRPIQTQLRLVTLAATLCLLAAVIGGWWRTNRIEREIAAVRSQQASLFREAFPDARVPGALLRRVRSEHARVMASRGASTQVEIPLSAPEVLRELLAALPADVRFRVRSIDILNGQVDLDLQVRNPVDAGMLATSLSTAGFDVKPPVTTQKDAKTYDSVLEAEWGGRPERSAAQDDISFRLLIRSEANG